ncbi:MAG: glucose-6-phosphate isomerase [Chlamydiales bacterium]
MMTSGSRSKESTSSQFEHYASSQRLKKLAQHPYDLTQPDHLTPERIHQYVAESVNITCLYATERVNAETLHALKALAQEAQAIEKMQAMQTGAIINKIEGYESENRPVLHTAMRDLFDNPHTEGRAGEARELALKEHEKLKRFLKKIEEREIHDLVVIGIGGSNLGPQSIYIALEAYRKKGRHVHFISNVDPDDAAKVFQGIDLQHALCLVISKSGGTLETLTNEEIAKEHFRKIGLDPKQHFVAITAEGSPLDNPEHYLESFYMWDFIGGRYSSTSMCGGVTLAFAFGYDVYHELLRGAHDMDQAALSPKIEENVPLLVALLGIWNHNFLNLSDCLCVPYSQALSRFPAHVQQLDMESNGKRIDRWGNAVSFQTGPFIWGEPGTNAQHSFYQLIHQGTHPVALELIGFSESQRGEDIVVQNTTSQEKLLSNLFAQAISLATGQKNENPNKTFPGNRPSLILLGKKLTPYTMGSLFALYEHKVAFQGFIWDINSFDQEGVQLGKVLAKEILQLFAQERKKQPEAKGFPLGEAYRSFLE